MMKHAIDAIVSIVRLAMILNLVHRIVSFVEKSFDETSQEAFESRLKVFLNLVRSKTNGDGTTSFFLKEEDDEESEEESESDSDDEDEEEEESDEDESDSDDEGEEEDETNENSALQKSSSVEHVNETN